MKPQEIVILFQDLAQIYQQKALKSLNDEDLAHAKRYREGAECIKELEQQNLAVLAAHDQKVIDKIVKFILYKNYDADPYILAEMINKGTWR